VLAKQSGEMPRLLVSRNFASGAALYCCFEVHNVARDPPSCAPRVSFDYALTDESGNSWLGERANCPSVLTATGIGAFAPAQAGVDHQVRWARGSHRGGAEC
jgi:hypothetical protein